MIQGKKKKKGSRTDLQVFHFIVPMLLAGELISQMGKKKISPAHRDDDDDDDDGRPHHS